MRPRVNRVVDISPAILERAAADAAAEGLDEVVRVRELDGERLDVEAGTFDAVVSRLGLIYFPDRAAVHRPPISNCVGKASPS